MTTLEPAIIGAELYLEYEEGGEIIQPNSAGQMCLTHKAPSDMDAALLYWETGTSEPIQLCGTTIPGNVRLDLSVLDAFPPVSVTELPMLDLSWTPPDPHAILNDILDRLGIQREPLARTLGPDASSGEWLAALSDALAWPPDEPPTQELKAITQEDA